jgi:FSR family fosmidomycin resistance protein-like MFS transporter
MSATTAIAATRRPLLPILFALSGAHLLNDLIQSMIPAMYPLFKAAYSLDFLHIGLISLAFQVTSSLLQPVVGHLTDRQPWSYAMVAGMGATLSGLLGLAFATGYPAILLSAGMVGVGSAVFHPEATRMARHAAAGQHGFAQGIFQIGGHVGYAIGPLLAAIIIPRGQTSLAWVSVVALTAMGLMAWTGTRYASMRQEHAMANKSKPAPAPDPRLSPAHILSAMAILIVLLASKNAYTSAFTNFYTFYLLERFGVTVQLSQVMLFIYLAVGAVGVVVGGMVGDRIGRHRVIWISILGALPFAILLPHADLFWTGVLSIVISFIMASAFASILLYAIDLVPHRVGLVGGLFYGLAFGLGGLAAIAIGLLADHIGIIAVFKICAWLPAVGLLTFLLPRSATAP